MHFEHSVTVPASRERVWTFVLDVPAVGRCVPGVESVTPLGDDAYEGTMKVRVGPISLSLQGKLKVVELNAEDGVARMSVEAADRRIGGAVKAQMELKLTNETPSVTVLTIVTEAAVLGKLGE